MISDTTLPNQPNTLQQPPLVKKKSNPTWTGFFILLIIFNLPFVGLIIFRPTYFALEGIRGLNYSVSILIQQIDLRSSFLLPLAIIDCIAIIWYFRKKPPPWMIFFISLFAINVIFFLQAESALSKSAGGVEAIIIIPFALSLLIIDLTAVLFYIIRINPHGNTKIISYAALIVISSVLIYALLFNMPFL